MIEERMDINRGGKGMPDFIPSNIAKPEKVTDMVGTFLNSVSIKAKTTQKGWKKVANTVGTFLNSVSIKAKTTQKKPEKVTSTVGTFLNSASIKAKTTQKGWKRLPLRWEPF
jgi:hypothetical protein